jgi:hypothetical protein
VVDIPTKLLLLTAVATAAFHTLIPDHWLPFVLIGRARNWSGRTTGVVAGFSALLHTGLSVGLGAVAIVVGFGAARWVGEGLERVSGVLLLLFGAAYALWAARKGGHFHPAGSLLHGPRRGEAKPPGSGRPTSEPPEDRSGLRYPADEDLIEGRPDRSALSLAVIVGLNPCVLVLPILVAAADRGGFALALVILAYTATTVPLMVGLSVFGVLGARRIPIPAAARHMETASGLLIAAVGALLLLLEG